MQLQRSLVGLSEAEIQVKHATFGYNEITEVREHILINFLKKFIGLTPFVIELSSLISLFIGKFIDALVMLLLLWLNAIIGTAQEYKANQAVSILKQRIILTVKVLRDGQWGTVSARELVPGDVVKIMLGDVIPADIILKEGALLVDQSTLTGESIPVEKNPGNPLYAGTHVVRGEGLGEVTNTGFRTYFGKTAQLLNVKPSRLIIEQMTMAVSRYLLMLALIFIGAIVVHFALVNMPIVDALPVLLTLLIASVPVAFPTMSAVTLALGSLDLAHKGVLVRKFNAVEAAAMMDVACLDKTGTITKNELSITEILPADPKYSEVDVIRLAVLTSERVTSDPIDAMICNYADEKGITPDKDTVILQFKPFDPHMKKAEAIISKQGENAIQEVIAKGAPQVVAEQAGNVNLVWINQNLERLAANGNRALGVAVRKENQRELVGLIAFEDLPRSDSAALIDQLKALGIQVKLITGDNVVVAGAIGKEVGVGDTIKRIKDIHEFPGLESLPDLEATSIIAEVVPEDKYRVIEILQQAGHHTVGMTGDGVNDAPALRKADVGIAVSRATDVARSAAQILLTQEGIKNIVDLILSGRAIYRRIITWILNKIIKTFEIVFFVSLITLISGQTIITSVQMLLILCLFDFATIAIAVDKVSPSPIPEKWNLRKLVVLPSLLGMLNVAELFGAIILGSIVFQLGPSELQSYTFFLIFVGGLLNLFSIREKRRFWMSKPAPILLEIIIVDILLGILIVTFGVLMAPLPFYLVIFLLFYEMVCIFFINDYIKQEIEKKEDKILHAFLQFETRLKNMF